MLGAYWEKNGIVTKVDAGLSRTGITRTSSKKRSSGEPYLFVTSADSNGPIQRGPSRKITTGTSGTLPPPTPEAKHKKYNYTTDNYNKNDISRNSSKNRSSSLIRRKSSQTSLSRNPSGKSISSSTATLKQTPSHSFNQQRNEPDEPSDEKISNDIATAVAMIVAEYELLKQTSVNSSTEEEEVEEENEERATTSMKSSLIISTENNERTPLGEGGVNQEAGNEAQGSTVPNPNNNPNTVVADNREAQPGTLSSGGEQAQSSLLPDSKADTGKHESSCVTIGLDLPVPVKKAQRTCTIAPMPTLEARMGGQAEAKKHLTRVQHYVNTLGYHREGEPDISINVRHSMKSHMLTAKDLIQAGKPIKCLHAVILAVYLTNALESVERFPIYFRSHVGEKEYKHIVLGIYCQGNFGALGISRDAGLQDKKLAYNKLSELIFEFSKCYTDSGHILNEIKIGTIITHDQSSLEKLFSKIGSVSINDCQKSDIESNVEKISKQLRAKMGLACLKASCFDKQSPNRFVGRSRSKLSSRTPTTNNSTNVSVAASTTAAGTKPNTIRSRSLSSGAPSPSVRTKSEDRVRLLLPTNINANNATPTRPPANATPTRPLVNTTNTAPKIAKVASRSKTKLAKTSKTKRK